MAKLFTVNEKCTAKYTATIKDEDGSAIPAASLTSLTLTLYDLSDPDRAIINSRDGQNVLNANNVTVDSSGVVTWTMQAADNTIQNDDRYAERHKALFVFTWDSGNKSGIHEVEFDVRNVEKRS